MLIFWSHILGRRTAFVEFHRRSDAEYFMGKYAPEISFPLEHSRGVDSEPMTFRIAFSRSRDEAEPSHGMRGENVDWECAAVSGAHLGILGDCRPTDILLVWGGQLPPSNGVLQMQDGENG